MARKYEPLKALTKNEIKTIITSLNLLIKKKKDLDEKRRIDYLKTKLNNHLTKVWS